MRTNKIILAIVLTTMLISFRSTNKVSCPKCKKSDKVYKIQYGDAPVTVRQINASGDTTESRIYKGKYQAGTCVVGSAKYYCDRDKVEF